MLLLKFPLPSPLRAWPANSDLRTIKTVYSFVPFFVGKFNVCVHLTITQSYISDNNQLVMASHAEKRPITVPRWSIGGMDLNRENNLQINWQWKEELVAAQE